MASNIAIQTYALSVFFALLAVICVKNLAVERSSLCTNKISIIYFPHSHFNKIVAPIAETPLKLLVFRDGGG